MDIEKTSNKITKYKAFKSGDRGELFKKYYKGDNLTLTYISDVKEKETGNVKVLYYDNNNNKLEVEYEYVSEKTIEQLIHEKKEINLVEKYIDTSELIEFKNFTITYLVKKLTFNCCFWTGNIETTSKLILESHEIQFESTYFFNAQIIFYSTSFNDCKLYFRCSIMDKKSNIEFHDTKFSETKVFFNQSVINGRLSFYYIWFYEDFNINLHKIKQLFFEKCRLKSLIEVKGCINELIFLDTINQGHVEIEWNNSNLENAIIHAERKFENEQEKFYLISKDFLLLKENYRNQGQYEWEDAAYRAYMKYYTKSLKWLSKKGFVKKPFNWLFGVISGYGTRVLNIILTCIVVIIAFGFGYKSAFLASDIPLWKSMYFSTITFLTIGYGNLNPMEQGFTRLQCFFTGAEGFLGLLLMSLVTVTIVRKILR